MKTILLLLFMPLFASAFPTVYIYSVESTHGVRGDSAWIDINYSGSGNVNIIAYDTVGGSGINYTVWNGTTADIDNAPTVFDNVLHGNAKRIYLHYPIGMNYGQYVIIANGTWSTFLVEVSATTGIEYVQWDQIQSVKYYDIFGNPVREKLYDVVLIECRSGKVRKVIFSQRTN